MTSTHAVERGEAPVPGQARRPRRHARSAGVRAAADRARRSDQDRSVRDGRPQDLSLHGALGRGARHRRQRRPRHRQQRRRGRRRTRSARCCRASPAPSSRSRRATPRSRSTASAPTISRATARSWSSRRARSTSTACDIVETPDADHTVLAAECGKGTYVRAIARDLGRALGCYGHVSALRRTGVGPFQEADSVQARGPAGGGAGRRTATRDRASPRCCSRSTPGCARSPRSASAAPTPRGLARGQAVLLRGRDAPIMQGVRRGIDPWRPDRAGGVRAGRIAAAAHLQSGHHRLNPARKQNSSCFSMLNACGTRCGLDFVAGSYISPGRGLEHDP